MKMQLSSKQISQNYQQCYKLTSSLLSSEFQLKGHKLHINNPEMIDLIQSVIGQEDVVDLIQFTPYNKQMYQSPILKSIDEVKKSFFPEVNKKRFFSINDERFRFLENHLAAEESIKNISNKDSKKKSLPKICSLLKPELSKYYKNKLLKNNPSIEKILIRFPTDQKKFKHQLNQKIYLFKKFYPDGQIEFTETKEVQLPLTKQQVIDIYLKVYLDIEKFFPKNFLQYNANKRSSILVKFLVEDILESKPQKILEQKDETLFIKHKLQNIYRLFNYSFNRILGNAYPELIHPWVKSKTPADYWENKENRKNAVKWLVEEKLCHSPDTLYKANINRNDFANNGLSFLFNSYYNSVSSALVETYPDKYPWELGNVSLSYWTDQNSMKAIQWLVEQKKWKINQLPARVQNKEFNKRTFSEYGLATLFEKKFNKNIFNAISLAYPNQFYPWEFGKVSSKYWTNNQNIYHASNWIAEQEKFDDNNIVPSILKGKLTFRIFEKYSIGRTLKKLSKGKIDNLFAIHFWKEHSTFLEEQRILRKIKNQNKRFGKLNVLRTLLYGFFASEVAKTHQRQQRSYRRITQRISKEQYQ